MNDHAFVRRILARDREAMDLLGVVREFDLPDWAIGAGFVRNAVWDYLHGYCERTPLADIDVLYFDPDNTRPEQDFMIEAALAGKRPAFPWSVRNQARMHLRNGDGPYRNTCDAIRYWLEFPTCVAVRLASGGALELLAPYGLDHLLAMQASPTPRGRAKARQYLARMETKNWQAT